MVELTAERFPEFFEELWGHPPFAWQRRLARRVVDEGGWPEALALPTAAGKTACIDIAVFAMAAGAQVVKDVVRCRTPRRIFFVVDRRIIVDAAYERARQIAVRLESAVGGVLREVADVLRMCARGTSEGWEQEKPLLTFQLRGGMYRSEAWARSPLQPIVVASTVDQVGSRLLFRGYGRGPGMWPVLAGLVANDSAIFLDEAHCARPFLETLRAVHRYRALGACSVPTTFSPVVLSATPPAGMTDVFRDTSDEPVNPNHPLGRRQLASKPAILVPPIKVSGKKTPDSFSTALAERATALAIGDCKAIVVFANRIATARAVYSILRRGQHDAILLTGRMRSLDKEDINERLQSLSTERAETRVLQQPKFVVATQTLEVGADLDFDGLVTECASLDALRQRFGRLNRRGRTIAARAAILIRDSATNDTDDPVYGESLSRTWAWLQEQASGSGYIDFGVAHLEKHLPDERAMEELNAPAPSAPVMLPAHLDAWAQTSPAPTPAPEVALFLHGRGRTSADVQVCWRTDVDLSTPEDCKRSWDLLTRCPPTSAECVPVPVTQLRRWMARQDESDDSPDVEGTTSSSDISEEPESTRCVLRWLSRNDGGPVSDPFRIRPGDVVVIPADGGRPPSLADFAEDDRGNVVADWGDRGFRRSQGRALLRLHPTLIALWPISAPLRVAIQDLLSSCSLDRLEEDSDDFAAELLALLRRIGQEVVPGPWGWLPEMAALLARDRAVKSLRNVVPHPFGGLILWSKRRFPVDGQEPETFSDEDDSAASGTVAVPLSNHLEGVGEFARRFARAAGMTDDQAGAVELAARLHDLGKADPRFQKLLGGGRFPGSRLLAKSGDIPQGRGAFSRAVDESGYPRGGRHELLSVRLAEAAGDALPADDLLRALVLHLVASHHGYCRPFAPVVVDDEPVDVEFHLQGRTWRHTSATGLERLDSGVSDRFWKLTRRYGWWGLAWLEAHLRLADHRRSEWEQQNFGDDDAA
jgi:CRISPR-associated endonuclease/helicase Cas3